MFQPDHFVLFDIDGLRPEVLQKALAAGDVPNLARLVGGKEMQHGMSIKAVAPAPSITFCSQACLFTGAHPDEHSVVGNQFFDRFGRDGGRPRHFAFDVGDSLAVDDAVTVFTHGLAGSRLQRPTIYELLTQKGERTVVMGNMYGKGATKWIKPSLDKIARFTKGGNLFGMSSEEYDGALVAELLAELEENGLPKLLTVYFMGLDHDSHHYGPDHQYQSLVEQIDPLVGKVWQAASALSNNIFVSIFSDHGQIAVVDDDQHSLRIGFPFDKEMGHLFTALGLDVHDFPGEDPNCDAVMALNGGLAYVYLQNRTGHWSDKPEFERDIVPVGKAIWEAHQSGRYATELKGAIAGVLLRNVAAEGWEANYQALTPEGEIVPLEEWFAQQPQGLYVDPVNRLSHLAGEMAGDIVLISHYEEGYYFGGELKGVHGGLHPDDSWATLAYGWPNASLVDWVETKQLIQQRIDERCAKENGRLPGTMDMLVGIKAALGLIG